MGLVLDSIAYTLTPAQRAAAGVIEAEFAAAGFSPQVAGAAIVNAWAESTLNLSAHRKTEWEDSAGLFQLNRKGAGWDMPTGSQYPRGDSRFDPVLNTRRFIREITSTNPGRWFRDEVAQRPGDLAYIAGRMCFHIERPKDRDLEATRRSDLARRMFPHGIVMLVAVGPTVSQQRPGPALSPRAPLRSSVPWVASMLVLGTVAAIAVNDWRKTRGDE